jgi:hypothetical protein
MVVKSAIRSDALLLIDQYIAEIPAFAQLILVKLREIIHRAHPEIKENWKWGAKKKKYVKPVFPK